MSTWVLQLCSLPYSSEPTLDFSVSDSKPRSLRCVQAGSLSFCRARALLGVSDGGLVGNHAHGHSGPISELCAGGRCCICPAIFSCSGNHTTAVCSYLLKGFKGKVWKKFFPVLSVCVQGMHAFVIVNQTLKRELGNDELCAHSQPPHKV